VRAPNRELEWLGGTGLARWRARRAALRRVRQRDASGNAFAGTVHALDAHDNVVHADGNGVVLYGVRDLVVVTRDGLTMVTTIDKASDLKTLIQSLPAALRDSK